MENEHKSLANDINNKQTHENKKMKHRSNGNHNHNHIHHQQHHHNHRHHKHSKHCKHNHQMDPFPFSKRNIKRYKRRLNYTMQRIMYTTKSFLTDRSGFDFVLQFFCRSYSRPSNSTMAQQHTHSSSNHGSGHKHGPNCKHGHNHDNDHGHNHNHESGHKHGPNCNHAKNAGYTELTEKQWQKRKARRKLKQFSRRFNHTLQNVVAAVWIWLLSESSLNYYYENNMYDKIMLFHGFQILSLMLFFYSSLSEPGFLEENNIQAFGSLTTDKKNEDEVKSLLQNQDIDQEHNMITINVSKETPPSFCRSCKFLRPIRAKHCYMCDRCVPRFDHHCPLIEQCVGAKNYRQFYVLCWSQLVVSGWSFMIAINCLFYAEHTNRSYLGWIFRILLFLWMLYQAFMATSLCSFHTYLICTQQTTFEFLKPKKLKYRLKWEKATKDLNNNLLPIDFNDDIENTQKRQRGIPTPPRLMLNMLQAMGLCLCYYPFSKGLVGNWYGFITAKCLEKPEYFMTKPVLIKKDPPKKKDEDKKDDDKSPDIVQQENDNNDTTK